MSPFFFVSLILRVTIPDRCIPRPTVQQCSPDAARVAREVQIDGDVARHDGDRRQRQRNRPVQRANRAMSRALNRGVLLISLNRRHRQK